MVIKEFAFIHGVRKNRFKTRLAKAKLEAKRKGVNLFNFLASAQKGKNEAFT